MQLFPHCVVLAPFLKLIWPHIWGFISGISVIFCWSAIMPVLQFWILCLCSKLWLQKYKSSSSVLFQDYFGFMSSLFFHMKFHISLSVSAKKSRWNFYNNCSIPFYILLKCFPPLFPFILYSGEFLWLHLLTSNLIRSFFSSLINFFVS